MSSTWSPKAPASKEYFTVDFVRQLATGDTITAASACTVAVLEGTDANPSAMLLGSPVVLGSLVSQELQGGVAGVRYTLTFSVTTAQGETLPFTGDFYVLAPY